MVEIWTFEIIVSVDALGAQSATVALLELTGSSGEGNEGAPYRISRTEIMAWTHSFATDEHVLMWLCSSEISGADQVSGFTGQYNNRNELIERARNRAANGLVGLVGVNNIVLNNGVPVVNKPNMSFDPTTGDEISVCIANMDNSPLSSASQEVHIVGKAYGVWL